MIETYIKQIQNLVIYKHYYSVFNLHNSDSFFLGKDLDGNLINVNSRHHQHCNVIADNFKTTHISFPMNSIVEGFEDLENQIWAVQWHPEKMESENNEYPLDKLFRK